METRTLSRRSFFKFAAAGVAMLAVAPSMLITGCAVNVKALLTTLIASIQGLLKVVAPSESWAANLASALGQLSTAVASWTAGGAVHLVEEALNAVQAVLAVIPLTSIYSPLVDVIVAGIDAVLNVLVPTPAPAARPNVHAGRVTLHRGTFETWQGAYKKQFNKAAAATGLVNAEIK